VVAQVMEDKRQEDHYDLEPLLGEDAFYHTLEDVVNDFRRRELKEA